MAEVVGLDGKRVDAEIPRNDRPEDVLEEILGEIKDGTLDAKRLVVIVEGSMDGSEHTYFTRASRVTNSEAIALATIGQRIFVDDVLDV